MGIAELATRFLVDPEKNGQQPPMGETDVLSQLYGRSVANNNVLSAATRGHSGRAHDERSSSGFNPAEQPPELDRSLDAWSRA